MDIKIEVLSNSYGLIFDKATSGSACVDLPAAIFDSVEISTGETVVIPCGFKMEVPEGYVAKVYSRSGLASKGVLVTNSPGIIDSDYRGEVKVILTNFSKKLVIIDRGNRIAQMNIEKTIDFELVEVDELSDTERGEDGFGSTGV